MRNLGEDDVCPICQDTFEDGVGIVYCVWGCGNAVHASCMGSWIEYRQASETEVTCPFCREKWSLYQTPLTVGGEGDARGGLLPPSDAHPGTECAVCRTAPIKGPRYRCVMCRLPTSLCARCFDAGGHPQHSAFDCKPTPDGAYTRAPPRRRPPAAPTQPRGVPPSWTRSGDQEGGVRTALEALQMREISPNDYDLLLQLDDVVGVGRVARSPLPPIQSASGSVASGSAGSGSAGSGSAAVGRRRDRWSSNPSPRPPPPATQSPSSTLSLLLTQQRLSPPLRAPMQGRGRGQGQQRRVLPPTFQSRSTRARAPELDLFIGGSENPGEAIRRRREARAREARLRHRTGLTLARARASLSGLGRNVNPPALVPAGVTAATVTDLLQVTSLGTSVGIGTSSSSTNTLRR